MQVKHPAWPYIIVDTKMTDHHHSIYHKWEDKSLNFKNRKQQKKWTTKKYLHFSNKNGAQLNPLTVD